ncbi:MAG TPA: RNA polymerase sigma factor [Gemmatimonadaceae bacterium]|nr:RNA polymerase sigma factor [Gemmatimonadaceae bacterium]
MDQTTPATLHEQLETTHVAAFGWALACCRGDRHAAEEVLHNVYVAILEGRARFEGRSAFRTWLFSIIRISARAGRRREWLRGLLLRNNAEALHPAPAPDSIASAERASRAEHLRAALATLSTRQREVLHLVFYESLTVDEAARVMRVSVGSARTHYARGKERLATLLGGADL